MLSSTRSRKSILIHLLKSNYRIISFSAIISLIGGISTSALLVVINECIRSGVNTNYNLLIYFVVLCVIASVSSVCADISVNLTGQRIIASARRVLAARILVAPIDALERYRTYRLIPVLTHDIETVSNSAVAISSFAVSATICICGLTYLLFISPTLMLTVVFFLFFSAAAQIRAQSRAVVEFNRARSHEDQIQKCYRAIAEGAKELRLHRERRYNMYNLKLKPIIQEIYSKQIRAVNLYVSARAFNTITYFSVVGVVLLARDSAWLNIDFETSAGFIIILLYLRGQFEQIIGVLPVIGRAIVSLRRIDDLAEKFSNPEIGISHTLENVESGQKMALKKDFALIELQSIKFSYNSGETRQQFAVGPINLKIRSGEIIFIVGENGSGKTTLIKLVLALYAPATGALLLDGQEVTAESRDDYRQMFTTIFSDYYLFDDIIPETVGLPKVAIQYLRRFEIDHKIGADTRSASEIDLSTGQRKRLALLKAWLEDRPILIFDEWAADQDPMFRRVFYQNLLPELKNSGKTVIAISHDDRYFEIADQILCLKDGVLTNYMSVNARGSDEAVQTSDGEIEPNGSSKGG